ncbi:MAG: redoxin domain-containing protein [Oscillochloris sp.]|nr:redoxin domain-containing protein [Oscillochloris sp.]
MTSAGTGADLYNYTHFSPNDYHFEHFTGLAAGDHFQDARVYTLDGQPVHLSDYLRDKPLVLETGSLTCPMYAQSLPGMQALIDQYPELDFVLLYVREAHPGERQHAHRDQADKLSAAQRSATAYQEHRVTLVDDVDGAAHTLYGAMPNSIYVIAPDGTILFRSIWNNPPEIAAALGQIAHGHRVASRDFKPIPPFAIGAVRTLLRGGLVALWDLAVGLPRLVFNHKKVGNL